jgi:hypothetical protein
MGIYSNCLKLLISKNNSKVFEKKNKNNFYFLNLSILKKFKKTNHESTRKPSLIGTL